MENTKVNFKESNEVEFEFKLLREKVIQVLNEIEENETDENKKNSFTYQVSPKKMEKRFLEICNLLSEGKQEIIFIGYRKSEFVTIGLFTPRFNLREEFKIARKKDFSSDQMVPLQEWIFRQLRDNGYKSIRIKYLERE